MQLVHGSYELNPRSFRHSVECPAQRQGFLRKSRLRGWKISDGVRRLLAGKVVGQRHKGLKHRLFQKLGRSRCVVLNNRLRCSELYEHVYLSFLLSYCWLCLRVCNVLMLVETPQSAWHTPRWALSEQNIFGTMEPQLSSLRTPRHIDGRKALISRLALKDPSSVFAQQERALERGLGDCHNAFRPAPAPSLAGFWSSRGPSPFPAPLLIPKPPNTSRQRHRICQRGTHRLLPPGGRHSQARAEAKLLQPHSATAF